MKPAGPPLSPRSAGIRVEYTFCNTHLRIETSNMLEKTSVSVEIGVAGSLLHEDSFPGDQDGTCKAHN